MKITNGITWDHRGRVPEGEKGQLEVRITLNRKSYYFGTGIKCRKSEFVAGQIVSCPGAKELNDRLAIIYSKVLACVNACVGNNQTLNPKEIREKVWDLVESQSDSPTFLKWVEEQIPLLNLTSGTRRHYDLLLARLIEFNKIRRWQDVTIENIYMWDSWLHNLTKPISDANIKAGKQPEKISDGSVWNYHKNLKAMLARADKFGKIARNPYDRLRGEFPKGEKESVEYLTEDDVRRFESLELPEGSPLDVARDLFILQLYTGLAYSDMQAFDISQYKWDGKHWNHIGERIKTGTPYVSVLLPPVVKVLKKYGMSVPKLNNSYYNKYLKSLAVMAGITTRMHTHLARHTFATTMLSNDAKIQNVSKMLGHKNIQQTQRYAKVLAKDVHDDFEMYEKKLNSNSKNK